MGAFAFTSVNPRLMQTVLRHMDNLRRSIEGEELLGLIARILRKHNRRGPIDEVCFAELYHQLDAYARDPIALPTTRIKAKLLQQHIAPCLGEDEQIESVEIVAGDEPAPTAAEHPVASSAPVNTLEKNLVSTPNRNAYETLRRSEQDAWHAIYNTVKDFGTLKQFWVDRFEELSREREQLEQKLIEAEGRLQTARTEREQLLAGLDSVRAAPARKAARRRPRPPRAQTPRLVTRGMFLQQLQTEISRVKRSGGCAALALLGIHDLTAIEPDRDAAADNTIWDCYAREIFSSFRAHDVVGRYADDAFAVLFPDTLQAGAVRALEKARKRAVETQIHRDGRRFPLPVFRGALSVYSSDDEPDRWLQRAEAGLADARRQNDERLIVV